MADIYGSHFEYGGVSSRRSGLIIVNLGTTRLTQVEGAINGVFLLDKAEKKRVLADNDYADFPVSFDVDLVTDDGRCLGVAERRAIEKWLFNRHSFRKFYMDPMDDCIGETTESINGEPKRIYLNCRFINPEKLEYNGGVVGYRATLEADSGLWWQEPVVETFAIGHTSDDAQSNITVHVDTALDDYTYPKVTVKMSANGGSFVLINVTDDNTRITGFDDIGASASVVLKGGINYVSGDYYEKFYMQNFPRLLDGDNNFIVRGNVKDVTFEFQNRRALT